MGRAEGAGRMGAGGEVKLRIGIPMTLFTDSLLK